MVPSRRPFSRAASFKVAFAGIWHAISTQRNFQTQLIIGVLVIIGAFLTKFNRFEWLILLLMVALVLFAELLNTVIEVVVDLAVKEELLPDAKIAKDVAAAAVLLLSLTAVVIGLILFLPHLF